MAFQEKFSSQGMLFFLYKSSQQISTSANPNKATITISKSLRVFISFYLFIKLSPLKVHPSNSENNDNDVE